MSAPIDRFYPIVDSANWVERLLPLGIRLVQLRIKDQPVHRVRADVRRAEAACRANSCRLVINDYWQIALEQGCSFVHLGQEDLIKADVAALKSTGIAIGISTHDHDELDRALSCDPDYVALGPVYPTRLKQMPWAPQGLDRLTEWKRLIGTKPLVAIGGLTCDRLPGVFAAGADSAAVITDIVTAEDPVARASRWLEATRRP